MSVRLHYFSFSPEELTNDSWKREELQCYLLKRIAYCVHEVGDYEKKYKSSWLSSSKLATDLSLVKANLLTLEDILKKLTSFSEFTNASDGAKTGQEADSLFHINVLQQNAAETKPQTSSLRLDREGRFVRKIPLSDFDGRFRGLFLFMKTFLTSSFDNVFSTTAVASVVPTKIWTTLSSSSFHSSVKSYLAALKAVVGFGELAVDISDAISGRVPYAVALRNWEEDMKEKAIDVSPFLQHIGEEYTSGFRQLLTALVKTNASSVHSYGVDNSVFRFFSFGMAFSYYLMRGKSSTARKCIKFLDSVSVRSGRYVWNLLEEPFIKQFVAMTWIPRITTSQKFFISPLGTFAPSIVPREVSISSGPFSGESEFELDSFKEVETSSASSSSFNFDIHPPEVFGEVDLVDQEMECFQKWKEFFAGDRYPSCISCRLISNKHVELPLDEAGYFHSAKEFSADTLWKSTSCCFPSESTSTANTNKNPTELSDELIIHFHGGGFISMSSFQHECYLRRWCLDLDVPVLSVDYRLAPEHPFPVPLVECYEAYKWALEHSHELGSTAKKVILAGDSAGGNLACGVVLRAIAEGLRLPDLLVLPYPGLFFQSCPSTSRLISLFDPMVNINFLKLCQNAYVGETPSSELITNPYISPLIAPNSALKLFPPVYICVGSQDPLLDDALMFAERLNLLKRDVTVEIWDGLGHGFLNLINSVKEGEEAMKTVAKWIKRKLHK